MPRITLDTPWLASALASNAPPEVIVDYLQDNDCTLSDVLLLYAGDRPAYVDGIGAGVLIAWLKAKGDGRAEEVSKLRPDVPMFVRSVSNNRGVNRALLDLVGPGFERIIRDGRANELPKLPGNHPAVVEATERAKRAIDLDLKARTLNAFGVKLKLLRKKDKRRV